MFAISEIPNGSNDGDYPNKKRREEGSKKPQEQEEIIYQIPDELTVLILAQISRFLYPELSLKCSDLHRVITSPALYNERSRIRNTEPVLYALIGYPPYELPRWYILNNNTCQLRQLTTLVDIPYGAAVVTVGFKIYMFGGAIANTYTSKAFVIDCRFHTFTVLPDMGRARFRPAAGVIGESIHVFGGCVMEKDCHDCVEVFNLTTQTWSAPHSGLFFYSKVYVTCAMMQRKIYVLGPHYCFTYDPIGKWDTFWGRRATLRSLWQESSCVVDDLVLCSIDPKCSLGFPIVVFDVGRNRWIPVNGVVLGEGPLDLPNHLRYHDSKMASVGRKVVVLGSDETRKEIWCVKIALERRQLGTIWWGEVQKVERVFTSTRESLSIEHCRILTV